MSMTRWVSGANCKVYRVVKWYTTYDEDLCFLDLIILVSILTLMENIESRNIDNRLISNQITK